MSNIGWVRGTKSTGSEWGAYLWVLQNKITFQTSTSYWWTITNNLTVAITNVYVGSLGIYGPMESNVVDIGPEIPTNFPGEDQSDTAEYRVDITNVYYQLIIPALWITPRDVVVAVGSTNAIRFTVTGTNLTNGVTWALDPDLSGSGGATMQSNNWYSRDVYPGNIATNYTIRVDPIGNTNRFDEVDLGVVGVQSPLQYKIGTNSWADIPDPLYVCKGTTVDFKAIKVPANVAWPSDKPEWGGLVSGSGVDSNSYTFSTVSTNSTDYKEITSQCGNTITGRVLVVSVVVTNIKFNYDTGLSVSDALNIRQDYNTAYDISNGEWIKDGTNIPACYTTNKAVNIKVRLITTPAVNLAADIWAASTDSGGSLGDVVKTNVTFVSGIADDILFQISGTTPNCVKKTTTDVWEWKAENINGNGSSVCSLNTSGIHTIYTILNEPTHPWVNDWSLNSNVWTKVLDKICNWANGENTDSGVGGDVVDGIYNSGYEYDTGVDDNEGGESRYYDDITGNFKLSTCLSEWGDANKDINCWDTANMFAVFSNAGGCEYDLYYITSNFFLNYIKAIGRDWSNDPFTDSGRQGFALHWTGWSNIFDPCLQIDDDADPTSAPHTGSLPKNMIFNAGSTNNYDDYRGKLVDPAYETSVSGVSVQPFGIE